MQQLKDKDTRYTVRDYQSWPDDERWELIDGVAYDMSPAPRPQHQSVVVEFTYRLRDFLDGKTCKVFVSPIDVYLNGDEDGDTVVQPDLLVVCDHSKIKDHGIVGAPDVVIEVLSPSSMERDMLVKRNIYERSGVKEYWIVSTEQRTIYSFNLINGRFEGGDANRVSLTSDCIHGFTMDIGALFAVLDE